MAALLQTSNRKAEPTNDGHLGYTDIFNFFILNDKCKCARQTDEQS